MKYILYLMLLNICGINTFLDAYKNEQTIHLKLFLDAEECMCEEVTQIQKRLNEVHQDLQQRVEAKEITSQEADKMFQETNDEQREKYLAAIQEKFELDPATDKLMQTIDEKREICVLTVRKNQKEIDRIKQKIEKEREFCKQKAQP